MASFTDDFNRANSSDLGAGWVEVSGDWSITSNQLSPGAAGGVIILRAAGAMSTDDNYAQFTVAATAAVSHGVWCRGSSNISDGYLWRNDGTSWDLFAVVGGGFTNIGTYAAAAAPGDVAKVQADGSTITAYVNGVERVSVTNTAVTSGTSVGIRSESSASLLFDDFSAGDVVATVTGSATADFGTLTGAASGVPTVTASGGASLGGLSAAAAGTRGVAAVAAFGGGALSTVVSGVRTVTASADGSSGALAAAGFSPFADAQFGALAAVGQGSVPFAAAPEGSWYALADILHEAADLARAERERPPVACPDCGEPLRTGPRGEWFCLFDGSIWAVGNRRVGQVGTGWH